jgi:hypothetical protein
VPAATKAADRAPRGRRRYVIPAIAAIIFFFGVALAPLVRENGPSTAGQILRRSIKHVSPEAASSFLPFDACNGQKFTTFQHSPGHSRSTSSA